MANEQLIEGSGKVKRRINVFVIVILAVVIGSVVFISSLKKETEKKAKQETIEVKQEEAPAVDQMEAMLNKQKEYEVPALPGAALEGVGTTDAEAAKLKEDEEASIEEAKERSRVAVSGILVLKEEGLVNATLVQPQSMPQQQLPDSFIGDYMRTAAAAEPVFPLEQTPAKPAPTEKRDQDSAWLDSQSEKTRPNPITEDPKNSRYTIFQGAVIPAVLESMVDSTFPGQIRARVIADVYDGVTGSHLIIPKGSTLFGSYSNNVVMGQKRILAAFERLVFPGGRSVSLQGMQMTDSVGRQGLEGNVDNHYVQRFGTSMLVALLGLIADRNDGTNTTVITGDANGVGSSAGQILQDISRENLERVKQIPPTITLKQGDKFNILVNRDMVITPYH
jgi:type IV secretory pathway VirB10-like protein